MPNSASRVREGSQASMGSVQAPLLEIRGDLIIVGEAGGFLTTQSLWVKAAVTFLAVLPSRALGVWRGKVSTML